MDKSEIKPGRRYRTKGGQVWRVEAISGQKVTATQIGGTPELEMSLGRFASRVETAVDF